MCTDCHFECGDWNNMKFHYKKEHPEVKRPDKYFTKEARKK